MGGLGWVEGEIREEDAMESSLFGVQYLFLKVGGALQEHKEKSRKTGSDTPGDVDPTSNRGMQRPEEEEDEEADGAQGGVPVADDAAEDTGTMNMV
ncbi:unnamed protein product [Arctogadus glacialis]